MQQLKDSCKTYGVTCGVYSSASQWSAIFGSTSFTYGSELPLWWKPTPLSDDSCIYLKLFVHVCMYLRSGMRTTSFSDFKAFEPSRQAICQRRHSMQSVSGQKLRQRSLHSIILLIPYQEINLILFLQQRFKSPARRDVTHWWRIWKTDI